MVHVNEDYTLEEALEEADGLAVMGFFIDTDSTRILQKPFRVGHDCVTSNCSFVEYIWAVNYIGSGIPQTTLPNY